ncbi:MAG: hypothetical protein GY744_15390 [Gammaproteobacteria bacterium]|nr:hypothetical protein [Gammaproteobacteria bacterium]
MKWKAVIAHAEGEEHLAEELAEPICAAGYDVAHRGSVLIGESFIEEASKALNQGGPVILCASVKAIGTAWAHFVVNAAKVSGKLTPYAEQLTRPYFLNYADFVCPLYSCNSASRTVLKHMVLKLSNSEYSHSVVNLKKPVISVI